MRFTDRLLVHGAATLDRLANLLERVATKLHNYVSTRELMGEEREDVYDVLSRHGVPTHEFERAFEREDLYDFLSRRGLIGHANRVSLGPVVPPSLPGEDSSDDDLPF